MFANVVGLPNFLADLDPAFNFNAGPDPDPIFILQLDPVHFDADLAPIFYMSSHSLQKDPTQAHRYYLQLKEKKGKY